MRNTLHRAGAVLPDEQYLPWGKAAEYPEINRRLRKGEARKAAEYMELLGLDGFVQEQSAASDQFIPDFDFSGL